MLKVLYVFGGEKASGAEKVIERLINVNADHVRAHLFISPGILAETLIKNACSSFEKITTQQELKKLNRSKASLFIFYLRAIKNYFQLSFKILIYLRKYKIYNVHANTIVPSSYLLPAIWFSKIFKLNIKWIWSDHDLKYFSGIDHKLSRLCVKAFDQTLAVSEAVKSKYQAESKKVIVLYNGLDPNLFFEDQNLREIFRSEKQIRPERIVIGLAGTIEPRKGQLALINVFHKIQKQFPEIYLVLAGSGSEDYPEYVNQVFSGVKINNNIKFLGKIEDMLSYYNGCDIIVNNSNSEGSEPLGTTIYEAMACKRIVVASKTGGSPEIIDNEVDGYLFSPESEEDLFQNLRNIILNINDQQQLRLNARYKVENRFNTKLMKIRYNHILSSSKVN